MTPEQIINRAKRRLKNFTTSIEWADLFKAVMDDIFTRHQFKFARQSFNYMHDNNLFEHTFNTTLIEKALNKINSLRFVGQAATPGPLPITSGGRLLNYVPSTTFYEMYPEPIQVGTPHSWTELKGADGSNGMVIGIYPLPPEDLPVWVDGDFIPVYDPNNTTDELPILPAQFHRLVSDGIIQLAAEEGGQDKLALSAEKRYELGIQRLEIWDRRNPAYNPVKKGYDSMYPRRRGPFLPDNFPVGGR